MTMLNKRKYDSNLLFSPKLKVIKNIVQIIVSVLDELISKIFNFFMLSFFIL